MALYGVETTITYVAWDTSANAGKTGDAANHTLRWVKDGTAAAPTNTPSEVDATNAPGIYKLTLTASECQAIAGTLGGNSSTANVSIIPVQVMFERLPNAAPGSANGLPILDANSRVSADVTAISGDSTAADNAEAMFDGTGYAGGTTKLEVNVTQIEGSDATDQIRDAIVDDETRLDGSALNSLASHDPGVTLGTSTLTAADVWGYTTRTLSSFGTLVNDIWAAATRTLTSFGTLASDVWSVATRTITGMSSGAITADAIAANAIGASELAADAVAEIADAVWDEARADHEAAGTFGEGVASVQGEVSGDVAGAVGGLAAGAITASAIADGTITAAKVADGAVTSAKLADGAITSAKLASGAITADAIAADAIGASELSAEAIAEIADAVLEELVATHKATAGSLAAVLNEIWRRVGYGAIVTDSDANSIATYDAATATGDPVLTQTGTTVGSETTWTPS